MAPSLRFTLILAVAVYFVILAFHFRRKRIKLRFMLLWIFSGILMLLLALFPDILYRIAALMGIVTPVNALFVITLFCIILLLISLTAIVSLQNDSITRLAQENAMLEQRVRELEEKEAGKERAVY